MHGREQHAVYLRSASKERVPPCCMGSCTCCCCSCLRLSPTNTDSPRVKGGTRKRDCSTCMPRHSWFTMPPSAVVLFVIAPHVSTLRCCASLDNTLGVGSGVPASWWYTGRSKASSHHVNPVGLQCLPLLWCSHRMKQTWHRSVQCLPASASAARIVWAMRYLFPASIRNHRDVPTRH